MNDSSTWREPVRSQMTKKDVRLPFLHQAYLLFWTVLVSLTSILFAFFPNLKTAFQWQEAYTAWATFQGQLPYLDSVSHSGFFYHGLSALSQHLAGPYLYVLVQALCLYLAGLYCHKLLSFLIRNQTLGLQGAVVFYLLNLAFGLGGFYPMQLASPFIFMGLWVLATHRQGLQADEAFIGYGLALALSVGFEPKTLLFWLLAAVVTLVVRARQGLWARGFYQFLALVLGLICVAYPAGYLVLNLDLLRPYLEQTLLGNLPQLNGVTPLALGLGLLGLASSGLLTGLFLLPRFFGKMAEQKALVVLLSLSTLAYTALALFSPGFQAQNLLLVLPFGLPLTALALVPVEAEVASAIEKDARKEVRSSHRRRRVQKSRKANKSFLSAHAFLPLLLVAASVTFAGLSWVNRQNHFAQSQELASHLQELTLSGDHLTIWDDRAHLYLDSQTLSATAFPVAGVNTQTSQGAKLFLDQLLQDRASYVLVNKSLPLPKGVQQVLTKNYKPVTLEGIDLYTLYQLD